MTSEEQTSIFSGIAHKSAIVFIGLVISTILGFIGRVLFARFFSTEEYGIFIIGITITGIFSIIGVMGLRDGLTRQIAFFESKGDLAKVKSVISWSFLFGLITSFVFTVILFFSSDFIAYTIFHDNKISYILRIFAFSMPFSILTFVLIATYRGFKKIKEKVVFSDLLMTGLFPIFLIPVLLFNLSYEWGIISYIASLVVGFLAFSIYYFKDKKVLHITFRNLNRSDGKELLIFSLPLLGLTILFQILLWTDTFMIGYFIGESAVGIYNTASPLGQFVSFPLGAVSFIFAPIVANLLGKNNINEIKKTYLVITKWLTGLALPLFLVFILFPGSIITIIFGSKYISASLVLQIIAIGYFINILLGPDGDILIPMGKTIFLMWATLICVIINIVLNIILIPIYGIYGAAIASVIALISINLIRISKLYFISNIHPFKKNIFAPTCITIIGTLLIFYFIKIFTLNDYLNIVLIVIFSLLLFILSILITKSIDQDDIDFLIQIQLRTGINLNYLINLVKKCK